MHRFELEARRSQERNRAVWSLHNAMLQDLQDSYSSDSESMPALEAIENLETVEDLDWVATFYFHSLNTTVRLL